MINKVILVGRITKDPELKSTQSNIAVVTFTIAVNRQFKDDGGEKQADFIQCVVWRKQAENLAKYCFKGSLIKGSLIGIDGRIQTRQYEGSDGIKYVTEVVCDSIQFLEAKRETQPQENDELKPQDFMVKKETYNVDPEDLPF